MSAKKVMDASHRQKYEKKDLTKFSEISNYTIRKTNAGNNVTVEALGKIHLALDWKPNDIMEVIPDEPVKAVEKNG